MKYTLTKAAFIGFVLGTLAFADHAANQCAQNFDACRAKSGSRYVACEAQRAACEGQATTLRRHTAAALIRDQLAARSDTTVSESASASQATLLMEVSSGQGNWNREPPSNRVFSGPLYTYTKRPDISTDSHTTHSQYPCATDHPTRTSKTAAMYPSETSVNNNGSVHRREANSADSSNADEKNKKKNKKGKKNRKNRKSRKQKGPKGSKGTKGKCRNKPCGKPKPSNGGETSTYNSAEDPFSASFAADDPASTQFASTSLPSGNSEVAEIEEPKTPSLSEPTSGEDEPLDLESTPTSSSPLPTKETELVEADETDSASKSSNAEVGEAETSAAEPAAETSAPTEESSATSNEQSSSAE